MFFKPNIDWLVGAIIGGVLICMGYLTFGQVSFDRIFFFSLIFVGVICRKEVNMLSVVVIVLASQVMSEAGFNILDKPDVFVKLFVYPALIYAIYNVRGSFLDWLVFPVVGMSIVAEIYWFIVGYNPPEIIWHLYLITLNMTLIFALDMRFLWVSRIWPREEKELNIDFIIKIPLLFVVLINSIETIEYIFRHMQLTSSTVIYYAGPYINSGMAIMLLWLIFLQAYLLKSRKTLTA